LRREHHLLAESQFEPQQLGEVGLYRQALGSVDVDRRDLRTRGVDVAAQALRQRVDFPDLL
jgi:hypothetical protein